MWEMKKQKEADKRSKFVKLHNDWRHLSMIMPSAEHNTQLQSMEIFFFFSVVAIFQQVKLKPKVTVEGKSSVFGRNQ